MDCVLWFMLVCVSVYLEVVSLCLKIVKSIRWLISKLMITWDA